MNKLAVLVLGPESSGTRFLTSAFIAAGLVGDATHFQRFDKQFPSEERIVWRRSYPHAYCWPDGVDLVSRLQAASYDVKIAVMMRDWHCMAHSQVERHHTATTDAALDNIQLAYKRIFRAINATNVFYFLVSYESLIHYRDAISKVMGSFGLATPQIEAVDENTKHFAV